MVHRYAAFISFHGGAHNIMLETKKDLAKQVHHAGVMVMDEDVDTIIQEWLDEWCGPLAEPLPKGKNEEDPPVYQAHGQGNEEGSE